MHERLLAVLLLLTIAWLIVRIRHNKELTEAESRRVATDHDSYHAVAIKYAARACDAAKAMTGRRFLSDAAPRLPLPGCDHPDCGCKFAHYDDRRTGYDRRSPFVPGGSSGSTGSFAREQRQNSNRRNADQRDK